MHRFICQICGSRECLPYFVKADSRSIDKNHQYVQCSLCRVVGLYPLPTPAELEELYETVHHKPHFHRNQKAYFAELDLTFNDIGFDPGHNIGSLLDIGCANGQFLNYMKSHGWTTVGCDISKKLTSMADHEAHKIYCGDLFKIDFEPGGFDMISMIDLIEHVLEPMDYIQKAALLLRPSGYLFLQTPLQGVLSEAYGEHWRRLSPPNHVHLFNFQTLTKMLNQHNFAVRSWVRWGCGNTKGTVPDISKRAWDRIAKELGIGDEISLLALKA